MFLKNQIIKAINTTRNMFSILNPLNYRKFEIGDFKTSLSYLDKYSPYKTVSSKRKNKLENFQYDLQIIIPVYNSAPYLRQCLDSVLKQETKYTYYIVLIDDGSTDNSLQIIDEYSKSGNILVRKQANKGSAAARNVGLENIKSKYIAFVDSDDVLSKNFIEEMLKLAYIKDADIVQCNLKSFKGSNCNFNKKEKIKYIKVGSHKLQGYAAGYICKSILFENVCFPEGYWFEDTINAFGIFSKSRNAYKIKNSLYFYRKNHLGNTSKVFSSYRALESLYITLNLLENFPLLPENKVFNTYVLKRQTICNMNRVINLPIDIQRKCFDIIYFMYSQLYYNLINVNWFEKQILNKRFNLIRKIRWID